MFERSQMNKGLLEGCILAIIQKNCTYGYDIVAQLGQHGFQDVKEGTIYPLLLRLEKKTLISSHYRPSPLGPSRKYYGITELGQTYLMEFVQAWDETRNSVASVLGGGCDDL